MFLVVSTLATTSIHFPPLIQVQVTVTAAAEQGSPDVFLSSHILQRQMGFLFWGLSTNVITLNGSFQREGAVFPLHVDPNCEKTELAFQQIISPIVTF